MFERMRSLGHPGGRTFEARLIVSDEQGTDVQLTVGARSLGLRWPGIRADEQVEILLDGVFVADHPFLTDPPDEITYADIQNWGPSSPPNLRWRHDPAQAPQVAPERMVAVVTKDLDYRFLLPSPDSARELDTALTQAIQKAGYAVT